jgi:hypothetical protein
VHSALQRTHAKLTHVIETNTRKHLCISY